MSMKFPSTFHISTLDLSAQFLPDGSFVVRRSPQEIEVWGVNISDHYTIRVETADDAKMDVIYLGVAVPMLKH